MNLKDQRGVSNEGFWNINKLLIKKKQAADGRFSTHKQTVDKCAE